MSRPLVSVVMVTYRQVGWVRQALESALGQDLEDIEVVVGDDASDDGTAEEVAAVAATDDRVRVLDRDRRGPRANYMRTLAACRGRYIAQLDGDDFWTSTGKLSAQVARLEGDQSCALCFTASIDVDRSGEPIGEAVRPPGRRERYGLGDLMAHNLGSSCAFLVRADAVGELPEWYPDTPVGDWPRHALAARQGDAAYIDEVMAAHRVTGDGVWTGKDAQRKAEMDLRTQDDLLSSLTPEELLRVRPTLARWRLNDARDHLRAGERQAARLILDWFREHRLQREVPRLKYWRTRWRAR
jgi:glycosyltransferase involved in cell wall biosynthesis